MAKPGDIHLSEVQLTVMRALWREQEATTATIYERMGKPRSLAYTTVATLLSRLEKRGLVRSHKDGRERVFEPLVSEAEVRRHMVGEIVSKLFRGDPRALVSHLVTDSEFDASDLEAVRRMLSSDSSSQKAPKGSAGSRKGSAEAPKGSAQAPKGSAETPKGSAKKSKGSEGTSKSSAEAPKDE